MAKSEQNGMLGEIVHEAHGLATKPAQELHDLVASLAAGRRALVGNCHFVNPSG
jgi:hypothetical protein